MTTTVVDRVESEATIIIIIIIIYDRGRSVAAGPGFRERVGPGRRESEREGREIGAGI